MIDTALEVAKTIILFFVGVSIGGTFADIDLAPPLPVKHRSAWTHGLLVPLGLAWLVTPATPIFWFALGFLPAYILHCGADMFPKKWHGGAFIKFYPLPYNFGTLGSFLWLLAGVVASAYVLYRDFWPVLAAWLG